MSFSKCRPRAASIVAISSALPGGNASGANVRHAVVDGEVVMADSRPTRFEPATVIREAQEVAVSLWRAAGYDVPLPMEAV